MLLGFIFIFIFGLIVGSFLNAVIYRLSVGSSALQGRSYCPRCKHQLGAHDLIPLVSFAVLMAKCRYCKKPISWQYPLVELATGIAFVLIYLHLSAADGLFTDTGRFIAYAIFAAFLVVIFVYDLLYYLILDVVVIPAIIVALIANLLLGASLSRMIAAALAGGGFFALQYILSRGRWIGGGDIRLGVLMGILLPWPQVLVALLIAYVVGSIIGIGLIVSKSKTMESKVPFGTFLSFATFVTLLYGDQLIVWYWRLAQL